jgi:hypothetical protein
VRHGHHASCLAYECDARVVIPLMICFDLNPNVQACVKKMMDLLFSLKQIINIFGVRMHPLRNFHMHLILKNFFSQKLFKLCLHVQIPFFRVGVSQWLLLKC